MAKKSDRYIEGKFYLTKGDFTGLTPPQISDLILQKAFESGHRIADKLYREGLLSFDQLNIVHRSLRHADSTSRRT